MMKPAGPPPGRASLHNAALLYLARFAATEAGLLSILDRRIGRWSQMATAEGLEPDAIATASAQARAEARQVVARLIELGLMNDAAFAENRARVLARAGRSRRAIAAHLAMKGVDSETARHALPANPDAELAAALIHARRRRLGPFRSGTEDWRREFAKMARAGFSADIAARALGMEVGEAEAMIAAMKQAGPA